MNTIKKLLFASACATLLIFTNCGGADDDPVVKQTAAENNAFLLERKWKLSSVTNGGTIRDEWTGFTLEFGVDSDLGGGSYTASGIPSDDGANSVWATSGTFSASNDLTALTRDADGVIMTMVASETNCNISFNVSDAGGRVAGFTGSWVFTMTAQ